MPLSKGKMGAFSGFYVFFCFFFFLLLSHSSSSLWHPFFFSFLFLSFFKYCAGKGFAALVRPHLDLAGLRRLPLDIENPLVPKALHCHRNTWQSTPRRGASCVRRWMLASSVWNRACGGWIWQGLGFPLWLDKRESICAWNSIQLPKVSSIQRERECLPIGRSNWVSSTLGDRLWKWRWPRARPPCLDLGQPCPWPLWPLPDLREARWGPWPLSAIVKKKKKKVKRRTMNKEED